VARVLPERVRVSRKTANRAPLMQYYRGSGKSAASPFVKKKPFSRSRRIAAKTLDTILIVAVIACLIYSLILQPKPRIISNSFGYHSAGVYQQAADKQFQALKNRSKVTIDEPAISTALKNQFPEIEVAAVGLPLFGQKPSVRLSISAPSFFFNSESRVYVVDTDGVVVGLASNLPTVKRLPTVNDQSGFKTKIGTQALSTGAVSFINQLAAQCVHAGVPLKSLVLPPLAQELDLYTQDKPYYVKFYLGGDPDAQIGQFLAARHQFATNHQDPSQYLDVRVGGKVYYK